MNELTSRYAQALFSLKRESNTLLETQEVVKELIKIIDDNPDFLVLLDSHYLSKEERLNIVEKTFHSIDEEVKNLIKVVVENNRALLLKEIFLDFSSLTNDYRGVKEGLVYSTEPLTENQLNKITKSISEKEKQVIELKNVIDPHLIGGVKVVINDHIYDGSIKHHIEQMRNTLLKEDNADEN